MDSRGLPGDGFEPGARSFYPGLHATDTLNHVDARRSELPFAWFALAFIGELAKTGAESGLPPLHVDGFESQD